MGSLSATVTPDTVGETGPLHYFRLRFPGDLKLLIASLLSAYRESRKFRQLLYYKIFFFNHPISACIFFLSCLRHNSCYQKNGSSGYNLDDYECKASLND